MRSVSRISENEFRHLELAFSELMTPYGKMLVAYADKGLCYLGFSKTKKLALQDLKRRFPFAVFREETETVADPFAENVPLYLYATNFQFAVWQALSLIPRGQTTTYKALAEQIGMPKAVRAVGTAIGRNPIAVIIPCHRVVCSDGSLGGYFWGRAKKEDLLKKENVRFLHKKKP